MPPVTTPIAASGTITLGTRRVHRLGFGAMQLTGPGVWGPPRDRATCLRVLQRAVELGVDFIDTADSYGPTISEELIREALHPYPPQLVIATKAGLTRTGPDRWIPLGRPEYLRQQCHLSLRRLGQERLTLFQLHRIDPKVPAQEQFECLAELQREGLVEQVGLSEVSVAQLDAARRVVPIATIQNRYHVADRASEDALHHCERLGIGFIPWFPLGAGALSKPQGPLAALARQTGHTPSQLALAWLLARSPVMMPIPGTSSIAHLEENCAAGTVQLTSAQLQALEQAARA